MAILAIKGNSDRSEDIKKLFTDLGASEIYFECCDENYLYFMSDDKKVTCIPNQLDNIYRNQLFKVYTIDELEKQFPFRVGDIVTFDIYTGVKGLKKEKTSGIKSMSWLRELNEFCYITEDEGKHFAQALRVPFEPKDGDIVYVKASCDHIIIYKEDKTCINRYVNLHDYKYLYTDESIVCDKDAVTEIRPATEEEKKKLFDKLAEEGWEWDAEKREIIKLKWRPNLKDTYWYPLSYTSHFNPFYFKWFDSDFDRARFESGWCFRTEEECQAFCDKLNQAIEGVKP